MKIIIYDHIIAFKKIYLKRGELNMKIKVDDKEPMDVSGGDTLGITHKVDLSFWDVIRAIIFGKVLTVTKEKKL